MLWRGCCEGGGGGTEYCQVGLRTETFDSTVFTPSVEPDLYPQNPLNLETAPGWIKRPGSIANVQTVGGRVRVGRPSANDNQVKGFGVCHGRVNPIRPGFVERAEITICDFWPTTVQLNPVQDVHEIILDIGYLAHVRLWWVDYRVEPLRWRWYLHHWWGRDADYPFGVGFPAWELTPLVLPIKLALTVEMVPPYSGRVLLHVNDQLWSDITTAFDYGGLSSWDKWYGVRYHRDWAAGAYWYELDDWVSYTSP